MSTKAPLDLDDPATMIRFMKSSRSPSNWEEFKDLSKEDLETLLQTTINRLDPNHPSSSFWVDHRSDPSVRAEYLQTRANEWGKAFTDKVPPAYWKEDGGKLHFLDKGDMMIVRRAADARAKTVVEGEAAQEVPHGWTPTVYKPANGMGSGNERKCAGPGCNVTRKLYACAACNVSHYCSKECQRANWKFHKEWCQRSKDSLEGWNKKGEEIQMEVEREGNKTSEGT